MKAEEMIIDLCKRADDIGLSKSQMARECGIAPFSINRWVRGVARPRYDNLLAIKLLVESCEAKLAAKPDTDT
jgi:predicted transcriptional regulator